MSTVGGAYVGHYSATKTVTIKDFLLSLYLQCGLLLITRYLLLIIMSTSPKTHLELVYILLGNEWSHPHLPRC